MITNPLLQAKYEAQMRLDEKANHDIKRYVANSQQTVWELAQKYGLTIRYGEIKGGYLEPEYESKVLDESTPILAAA